MKYAEASFKLIELQADGKTLRDHLEVVYDTTGNMPDALILPERPERLAHVLCWFEELCLARQWAEHGPQPLAYTEIINYMTALDIEIKPWEVRVIKDLDAAYLKAAASSIKKRQSR